MIGEGPYERSTCEIAGSREVSEQSYIIKHKHEILIHTVNTNINIGRTVLPKTLPQLSLLPQTISQLQFIPPTLHIIQILLGRCLMTSE